MTPEQSYQDNLQSGTLEDDEQQAIAVQYLQHLYDDIINNVERPSGNLLSRFMRRKVKPVCGVYLWGGTGRGKTYLMDSFYRCLPFSEKYRVHFHRFMLDIHQQLRQLPKSPDPLNVIARQLATRYRLICLDEFHVHDIADAMLMAGLLKALFDNKVTLVATSNIAIDDLYKNGLQRERFIYAIDLLHAHTLEVDLGAGKDYRFSNLEKNDCYQVTEPGQGHEDLATCFDKMAVVPAKHNRQLSINNRPIQYIALADDLAWFDFRSLCATPRSANDYIEIAKMCTTVFISDIHAMSEAHDDVAKRFIHLVDALYDYKVKLVATAEVLPHELYSGKRLAFAFERTISRLTEMSTPDYLTLPHCS